MALLYFLRIAPKVRTLLDRLGIKVYTYTEFCLQHGPEIPHASDGFFDITLDKIAIRELSVSFKTDNIILHELVHWSGVKGRCDRKAIVNAQDRLAKPIDILSGLEHLKIVTEVREEEAIAQIGMFILCERLGLDMEEAHDALARYLKALLAQGPIDMGYCESEAKRSVEWIFNLAFQEVAKAA